jgi:hypothetical protein
VHTLFLRVAADHGWIVDGQPRVDVIPEQGDAHGVLPFEMLSQVYELLLGKVLCLTPGGQTRFMDGPRSKKAGGVYYTANALVAYVVQHTVGKLLGGLNPQSIKLRILDPACGAGSFLIGAYQYLLEWHRDWYIVDGPERHKKVLRCTSGKWRLTMAEKQRILLQSIFGVDIDPLAVEFTRLSLLLKMLDGEGGSIPEKVQRLVKGHELPDLAGNVKCGDALLGPDFFKSQAIATNDKHCQIKVFDWDSAFPQTPTTRGFDAVVGNPPWGQKAISGDPALKQYVRSTYPSSAGIFDLFRPFVELSTRLLATSGMFGMVLPDIVLLKDYPQTRRHLLEQLTLERIDWWSMPFPDAVMDAVTLIGAKQAAPLQHTLKATIHDAKAPLSHCLPQSDFWNNSRLAFNLHLTSEKRQIVEQLQRGAALGDYFEIHEGVHSGNIRDKLFVQRELDETCRELYFGRGEIARYHLSWAGRYVRRGAVPEIKTRQCYANLGKPSWHERQKVLVRRTGDRVLAGVDRVGRYASNNFFLVFPKKPCGLDLDGLSAWLNSSPLTWYFRTIEPRAGRVFAELKIKHLATFPMPRGKRSCQALNRLGAQRALVAARLAILTTPRANTALQKRANLLDASIDSKVRELLGLPGTTR